VTNAVIQSEELHRIRCWTCTGTTRAAAVAAVVVVAAAAAAAAGGDDCGDDDDDNALMTTLMGFQRPTATTVDCSLPRRSRNWAHPTSSAGDFQRQTFSKQCQQSSLVAATMLMRLLDNNLLTNRRHKVPFGSFAEMESTCILFKFSEAVGLLYCRSLTTFKQECTALSPVYIQMQRTQRTQRKPLRKKSAQETQ